MNPSNIVSGGCDPAPTPSGSGDASAIAGAVGGLAQAAMSGNLGAALKSMAIEQGKKLATAALMKVFTAKAAPKPPKPPWTALGAVAAPGSALAAAAIEAYKAAHAAPSGNASAGGGNAASKPAAGAAGGSNAGGAAGAQKPKLTKDDWVDIDLNDLLHTAGAVAMMPIAILLRPLAALFPSAADFLKSLPATAAGTGDKDGIGIVTGNNDGNGTPGIVGIAYSLAHSLFQALGLDSEGGIIDGGKFETGQASHDVKTGRGESSDAANSAGDTIGQLLGILARKIGLGNPFYDLVRSIFGDPDGYGFVAGVWKGTNQDPA